jgi:hypothetical protein
MQNASSATSIPELRFFSEESRQAIRRWHDKPEHIPDLPTSKSTFPSLPLNQHAITGNKDAPPSASKTPPENGPAKQ